MCSEGVCLFSGVCVCVCSAGCVCVFCRCVYVQQGVCFNKMCDVFTGAHGTTGEARGTGKDTHTLTHTYTHTCSHTHLCTHLFHKHTHTHIHTYILTHSGTEKSKKPKKRALDSTDKDGMFRDGFFMCFNKTLTVRALKWHHYCHGTGWN